MTLFKALTVAAIALASQSVFAQSIRPCSTEALSCKLENVADFYNRITLDQVSAPWDGNNYDEPSIEPNECQINVALDNKKDLYYQIILGDSDYMANIFVRSKANMGQALPGEATFTVVQNKKFYFRHGQEMMTCELKK